MLKRSWFLFACVAFIAAPAAVRADEKPVAPLVQFRLKSLDRTLENLKYLQTLTGQENAGKQLEEMQKGVLPNGFDGIDTKKPWAVYGLIKDDVQGSPVVVMIPVTSEEKFIKLLGGLPGVSPTKNDGGYLIQPPGLPVAVHLQFAKGYAYGSVRADQNAADKADLLDPSVVFASPIKGSADFQLRIDQIPEQYKQLFLGGMEVQLANQQEKLPGEDEASYQGRLLGIKSTGELIKSIINDGAAFSFGLDLSREQEKLGIDLGLSAKKDSELAKRFGSLGAGSSLFANWAKPASAANLVVHGPLSEGAQKMVELVFMEGMASAIKKHGDAAPIIEKFKTVLLPTVKSGVFDFGFEWRGPTAAGHYTLVGGMRLVDGDKIESLVKETVAMIPEKERAQIKLDASSVGEFKVHKLDVASKFDKNGKQLLGDNPIYIAFRKDAVLVVLGENGLATLGEAIQAAPGAAPLAAGRLNLKSLVPLMKDEPRAEGFAKSTFTKAGDDAITLKAEGGDAVTIHFELKGAVLKFLSAMGNKSKTEVKPKELKEKEVK